MEISVSCRDMEISTKTDFTIHEFCNKMCFFYGIFVLKDIGNIFQILRETTFSYFAFLKFLVQGQVFLMKCSRFKLWTHCVWAAHCAMLGPHPNPLKNSQSCANTCACWWTPSAAWNKCWSFGPGCNGRYVLRSVKFF